MNDALVRSGAPRHATALAFGLSLLVTVIIVLAARRQSATFDEIFMVASGARGYVTGEFELARDHPPLMQYVYGLPVALLRPDHPPGRWDMSNRFVYARLFYFESGNDPERLAFWSRLMAALIAGALVFTVFAFTAPRAGPVAGLLAALLTGFTPDVLAHGGVAYNDVPIALAFFLALWAIDRAVRKPSIARVVTAAASVGLALAVKFSALALGPVAIVLLIMEALARGRDRTWWTRLAVAVPAGIVTLYLTLVAANIGDASLRTYIPGLLWALVHSGTGHSVPAFFLGRFSEDGFWYFYPVLFLLKTPAALHLLMLVAAGWSVHELRMRRRARSLASPAGPRPKPSPGDWLRSPWRAMGAGILVFAAILMRANLNIGFRHALPLVPPLMVLTAVALARLVAAHRRARWGVAAVVALCLASTLAQYPNFLSYTSEYIADRERADHYFVDSSLDWGQGLIQLREWMDEHDVPRVYLSYFGSALPASYGIDYVALPGYFQILTPARTAEDPAPPAPEWIVISATNRAGAYLDDDPFAEFREIPAAYVIANHLYVYPAPAR